MTRLSTLKNIGKTTETWLNEVGIHSPDDLRTVGAVAVYRRLKAAYPAAVTLNALWALEGALLGLDWRAIPDERKTELLAALNTASDT